MTHTDQQTKYRKNLSNHDEVCHKWANQAQPEGKCGNLFFEGNKIYSYGYHYEMGRYIPQENGRDVILINANNYSVTTSGHKSMLRQACSHHKVFTVPSMELHETNVVYLADLVEKELNRLKRATAWTDTTHFCSLRQDVQDYCTIFDVSIPAKLRDLTISTELQEQLTARGQRAKQKREAKQEANRLQREQYKRDRQLQETERLERWLAGESLGYYSFTSTRLRIKDGFVESTHGAKVSVVEAIPVYKRILKGLPIHGIKLDGYPITSWNGELKIGCHTIAADEVHRIGKQLIEAYATRKGGV